MIHNIKVVAIYHDKGRSSLFLAKDIRNSFYLSQLRTVPTKYKGFCSRTWVSPDGRTKIQIDHTLVNRKFRTSVLDTRAMRSADVASDHDLVRSTIRLKLKRAPAMKRTTKRFDTQKLQNHIAEGSL